MHAIQILCIHHKTTSIGDFLSLQRLAEYILNTTLLFRIAPPTSHNTKIHKYKTWHTLPDAILPI
jgi:hypothetical protein